MPADIDNPEMLEQLLLGIRSILRVFTIDEVRFPAAEGKIKYNALDFQTLYYLSERPGISSAALSRFLGASPTTTQAVVDRLVNRGLLCRENGEGRRVALSLTHGGEEVRAAIRRQDMRNIALMLSALPENEREKFADHVSDIAKMLEAPI